MRPLVRIALSVMLPVVGLIGLGSFAQEALELHVNPFKRPGLNAAPTGGEPSPAAEKVSAVPPLVLEGTVLASRAPLARINGKILEVGDSIEGYRLASIGSGQVTLNKAGEIMVLKLEQKSVSSKGEHE